MGVDGSLNWDFFKQVFLGEGCLTTLLLLRLLLILLLAMILGLKIAGRSATAIADVAGMLPFALLVAATAGIAVVLRMRLTGASLGAEGDARPVYHFPGVE